MKDEDVRLVRASFERVSRRADHAVKFFYTHLFANNPSVRGLFPEDMGEQRDRLFAALGHVVTHLDDPALPGVLLQLGRDHRKFEAADAHYDAVGASLVAALAYVSEQTWDARTEAAWVAAYTVAAGAMRQGAALAEAAGEPSHWDATVLSHRLHHGHTAVLTVLTDRPYPYRSGQYATLCSPRRPRVWRPYSVACAPRGDGILEFHVARVQGGLLSTALCDEVRPGDRLRLGPASGAVTAPARPASDITLFAAGSGWSSTKALLEELRGARPEPRLRLEILARTEAHSYDLPVVGALPHRHASIDVSWWHPRPFESRANATSRFHASMAARDDWADQDVYLSGPPAFVSELVELLVRRGADPDRVRFDPVPPSATAAQRTLSHAEHFLDPRPTPWIDPAARTGAVPDTAPPPGPGPTPSLAGRLRPLL
ncbi:globin domain-containing protein [Streptomyces sp. NPDC060194]|uniref:globin domain-containing protein n=1 Tax=Streptomyces sp. NPDC060194 TaxID=3347069 RepID=UPI003660984D